jgi:predicted regulator of Ras-like GTPase activity (Roadblock/LC7/MglB family)
MYKLTIRRQWFLFVGSLLFSLGLVIWLPSHCPDKVVKLPLLAVIVVQVLIPFGFAVLRYRSAPLSQIIQVAFTFLGVAAGIGVIGTVTSDLNQSLGMDVLVSWVQLGIMNIGGAAATVALYELHSGGPEYQSMQEATSEVVRTVKPRASVSATRLPALAEPLHSDAAPEAGSFPSIAQPESAAVPETANTPQPASTPQSASAPQPASTPQSASAPPAASAPQPAIQTPKDLSVGRQMMRTPVSLPAIPTPTSASSQGTTAPAVPEQPLARGSQPEPGASPPADAAKRGMNITNQRIQVQSKRKPSTFTKLQALSATGRSLTAPAGSGLEAEGLKSILDRLEDQAGQEASPVSQPAVKAQAAPIEASPAPAAKVAQPPPPDPAGSQAAPPKGSSIASRLVGVVTKNKLPAAQKPVFKFEPEPQAKAEAAPVVEPEQTSSASEQNFEAAQHEGYGEQAEIASSVGAFEPAEAPANETFAPDVGQGAAPASSIAPETAEAPAVRSNIFESSVDDEMDQLFSKLAPADAQQVVSGPHAVAQAKSEVQETAPQAFKGGADFTVNAPEAEVESEPVEAPYQEVEQHFEPEVPVKAAAAQAEPASDHLFGAEVDSEIDDIFSALAPAEAQREVVHPHEKEEEPVEALDEEAEIVAQPASAPVQMAARDSVQAPPSEPAQDGLFGAEVNEEIDDIFANLAPPEAQMNVSDRDIIKSGSFEKPPQPAAQPQPPPAAQVPATPPPQPKPAVEEIAAQAAQPLEGEELAEQEEEYSDEDTPIVNPVTKNIEVREFGRLSSKPSAPKGEQSTTGTMKTIGKLLIDVQAIENIIKVGETGKFGSGLASARVISAQRGEGIKALLGRIDSYQGVSGCLIVGHDGLVIASTVSSGEDKDALGALSSALLSTSNLATLKLEIGKLKQMVLMTNYGNGQGNKAVTTVLTDVDVGVLAVFFDNQKLDQLDGLLETIHATIHG